MQAGYSYEMGSMQGNWEQGHLYLMGDKKGGITTSAFRANFKTASETYGRLHDLLGLPFAVISLVRNPFDMVAYLT
jgi:hypothetical protein